MPKHYVILQDSPGGYDPRGAALALWTCRDQEVMISGPAETGKTYSCLHKLHALCIRYPGIQCAMVRKTRKSMTGSVLQTYERKVIRDGVTPYGGNHVEWYDYDNGSRIYVGGMDNPDKVLSSERDVIYVNQAEELTLDDWEKLLTRVTGRAGNMPYAQMIGDCNPWGQSHWILKRAHAGALTFFESRHEDNPVLYTTEGVLTEQGVRTMGVLDTLTGIRYQRLRHGRWVSAEGIIYDNWDRAVHVIERFEIPDEFTRYRVIDFGYTNPFVCQWWFEDKDGRLYLYRELYKTGLLVEDAAKEINRLTGNERIKFTICDHDAEDRATLERYGIPTVAAKKDVKMGIQSVQTRLRKAGDGKPRLFVFSDCLVEPDKKLIEAKQPTCFIEEVEEYIWEPSRDGVAEKEVPRKMYDHSCFVAGTRISTPTGTKRIEKIIRGDFVFTRDGVRRVLNTFSTPELKEIFEVRFSNGVTLYATHDHPILVDGKGYVPVDRLRYGDICWYQESEKKSSLMASHLGDTQIRKEELIGCITNQMVDIVNPGFGTYIKKSGNLCMVKYHQDIIYTTLTGTLLIIRSTISSVFTLLNTLQKQAEINFRKIKLLQLKTLIESDISQQSGINLQRGWSGTKNTQKKFIKTLKQLLSFVLNVVKRLKRNRTCKNGENSVQIFASREIEPDLVLTTKSGDVCGVEPCLSQINILVRDFALQRVGIDSVSKTNRIEKVYNIEVEGSHEYFANGILVHNCDASRYLSYYLEKTAGAQVLVSLR